MGIFSGSSSNSSGASASGGGSAAERKEEVKQQVRQELAMANAQELISNVNKHCVKMCIATPGTSLSGSDEACLSRCMDKYLASWDTVSRAYVARINQEKH
ncbi:protein translocase subunit [Coemansia thaxteri]|uniref:Mitochondrial import inner membrane translocase subunit n=1 Tax=Coemansia thaxteri TaxID=2663907 RepID=A0A9W8ECR4_9FUNG|nr:protein translocase subunit [Coemansia thaxteri]KAJ2006666.1 protein translocase subunit [Coemansia thaxteri]KAJ2482381.1 protein translocase subunit [Coemansia sp. RSA 2320]